MLRGDAAAAVAELRQQPGKDLEYAELTGTVQYDLWKNVISRAEIRWDYSDTPAYGPNSNLRNQVMLAANIIYKF